MIKSERCFHLADIRANSNKVWVIRDLGAGMYDTLNGRVGNSLQHHPQKYRGNGWASRKIAEQEAEGYQELKGMTLDQLLAGIEAANREVAGGNGAVLMTPQMLSPDRLERARAAIEALRGAATDAARVEAAQTLCDAIPMVLPHKIQADALARSLARNSLAYLGMLNGLGHAFSAQMAGAVGRSGGIVKVESAAAAVESGVVFARVLLV